MREELYLEAGRLVLREKRKLGFWGFDNGVLFAALIEGAYRGLPGIACQ